MGNSKKGGRKGMGRQVLTRAMLLPLTAQEVRAISLPAHLALVALQRGQGERDHTVELVQVLCRTNLMVAQSGADVELPALRVAVMVLKGVMENGRARGPGCAVSEHEAEAIAQLLTIHNRLLETLPRRWYDGAQRQIMREVRREVMAVPGCMPLPGSSGAPV
ncbi:hypothetical protein [Paraburkholderia heleia]|uniref:hypothetical protein n=1 Tax=Paraburkholderia heleia TaxID=634127 RepID=UPI002AB7D770|nr:hypothetical protein [Paraburkholderia heleia]